MLKNIFRFENFLYLSLSRIAMKMKIFLFVIFFTFANCDLDLKNFDWSSVKPLSEIKEWREAHPNYDAIKSAHPSRSPRILNGEVASPTELPYMAGVMLHFDSGNSWCGGSLISRNFVLTAAKCVHIVPSSSVLLGASNMNNVLDNIRVAATSIHSQFNFDDSINDIATLRLSRPADLNAFVGLVRLPNRRQVQVTFDNQQAIVAG